MKINLFKHKRTHKHNDYDAKLRILSEDSGFAKKEAYKAVRTKLILSMPKMEGGKVISVTSSISGEGKTTTVTNLAITFAQMGAKVLLMDCDIRKSRLHTYLELEREGGVTDVLCGLKDFKSAVKHAKMENLDVLTSGEASPNPAELFESVEFGKLIDEVKGMYDYIFIDVPPMSVVSDAQIILKHCTGTVLIVRKEVTTLDILDLVVEDVQKTGAKILGMIMLGVDGSSHSGKYGGYGRYGKYGKYGKYYSNYGNYCYEDSENKKTTPKK